MSAIAPMLAYDIKGTLPVVDRGLEAPQDQPG